MKKKLKLGDEVRDTVTGFTGIAVCRHSYLQGCDRLTVQPPIDKDRKMPESESFDEPQLEVVKPEVVKQGSKLTGGPEKYSDSKRAEG